MSYRKEMPTWLCVIGAMLFAAFLACIAWSYWGDREIVDFWTTKVTIDGHEYLETRKGVTHSESCPCRGKK